ncbi:hypothetical protein [Haliscomenobacter sp.]|uniref:hypothetical protein n=1 Tax=Haliscomenobacter sp. TaxID=2717303 RepID=UPI003BAA58E4
MNAIKIMGAALLLLFVLNVVSLGLLLRMNRPHDRPNRPSAAAEFLMRELKFNPAQRDEYQQLIKQHRSKMQEIEAERVELRHDLFAGIAQNDTAALAGLRQLEGEAELATFQHFQVVRRLGNAEQKQRFDQIIQEVMRKMAPRGRPHPKRKEHG